MKSVFHSTLIATVSVAFLALPLFAQDQPAAAAAGDDAKALKAEFQKALVTARKDPAVAAAFRSAKIMALNKVAETDPNFAEMAKKEIASIEKSGSKSAAAEGKQKKDAGNKAGAAAAASPTPAQVDPDSSANQ